MAICLVRIDDRLIHGQVVMGWTKMLNASVIVVVDDVVAADTMQKTMMKAAVPIGVRSAILDVAEGAALLNGPKLTKDRVFVIVKGPAAVLGLINAGVNIKKIIVGNMRTDDGKKRITKEVAASKEEWECFGKLDSKGVEIVVQWMPNGDSKSFNDILKRGDFSSL